MRKLRVSVRDFRKEFAKTIFLRCKLRSCLLLTVNDGLGCLIVAELDKFDYRLLELLQENSRLTGNELAQKVGLSSAACLRRVQRLRETRCD